MKNFYLIDYLKDLSPQYDSILTLLKFELDTRIYSYGGHFKHPYESVQFNFIQKLKRNSRIYTTALMIRSRSQRKQTKSHLTMTGYAYFHFEDALIKEGISIEPPIWKYPHLLPAKYDLLKKQIIAIQFAIKYAPFRDLIAPEFLDQIIQCQHLLTDYYRESPVQALLIPFDMPFWERLMISVFKKMGKPSFIFLHGLPARYNTIDDNLSDYLLVWGNQIKKNYIKSGFSAEKILVVGHPNYPKYPLGKLRWGLDNILVLTQSLNGAQHSDRIRLADRGHLISYLMSIQHVLIQLGVQSVRLRPHPSENGSWYFNYIDPHFFKLDPLPLAESLKTASLVIGGASTVLLESIAYGVNYLVYNPVLENNTVYGFPNVLPFDGSDSRIPVALTESDLMQHLRTHAHIDPTCWSDYVQSPLDIQTIKKTIIAWPNA